MQSAVLTVVGAEVAKHLGDVQHALPLRMVCKEWRDTATLSSVEAEVDLSPSDIHGWGGDVDATKKELFFRRCPRLRKLKYHVSPAISLARFEATMAELSVRLTNLEELVLLFNNPAQQFESRHLAVLAGLPTLRSITLQANFHPELCSFSVLSSLQHLTSLTVLPSEASLGLTDGHIASISTLTNLASLEFPGHARAFTGATVAALSGLPNFARLVVTSNKPQAVDYTVTLPALAGFRALTRRPTSSSKPLHLELGVPDAAFGAALLRAVSGPGLDKLFVCIRDAAESAGIAELVKAPGGREKLVGVDLEFRAAPTAEDVALLASCTGLQRLHLSCKCPRAPSTKLDWKPWLSLSQLKHLHVHINPAWREPLQPSTVAAMAAGWPLLEHLHLRLSPSDNATYALNRLQDFSQLRSLSLTWLGQAAPAAPRAGLQRRRSGSLEGTVFNFSCLPESLRELSLTSISTVRLAVPTTSSSTGEAAATTVPLSTLPNLTKLALDGNFGVSDALVQSLVSIAPSLAWLTMILTGRQTLSAAGLEAAAAGLVNLSSLHLSDYREAPLCLSQACLSGLAAAGSLGNKLRQLKLSTPDVVHAELLPSVFSGFTKLRRLDLVGCQEQAATALAAALPLCCMKHTADWAGDVPSQAAVPPAVPEAAAVAA